VVGPQGKLTGNVANIRSMLVEGHVIGNISVERLALRGAAFVCGDITCKSISVEPSVMISGRINIHPLAPKAINPDGSVTAEAEKETVTETAQREIVKETAVQKEKDGFYFTSAGKEKEVEQMVVSPDKRSFVPADGSDDTSKKQEEEKHALDQLGEQKSQLEHQISDQKEHASRAREEEEKELARLKAETERLKAEEERHQIEAKRLQAEAAAEVAKLQEAAAVREKDKEAAAAAAAAAATQDATPPPDVVA
jgi:hypothetical protein